MQIGGTRGTWYLLQELRVVDPAAAEAPVATAGRRAPDLGRLQHAREVPLVPEAVELVDGDDVREHVAPLRESLGLP